MDALRGPRAAGGLRFLWSKDFPEREDWRNTRWPEFKTWPSFFVAFVEKHFAYGIDKIWLLGNLGFVFLAAMARKDVLSKKVSTSIWQKRRWPEKRPAPCRRSVRERERPLAQLHVAGRSRTKGWRKNWRNWGWCLCERWCLCFCLFFDCLFVCWFASLFFSPFLFRFCFVCFLCSKWPLRDHSLFIVPLNGLLE